MFAGADGRVEAAYELEARAAVPKCGASLPDIYAVCVPAAPGLAPAIVMELVQGLTVDAALRWVPGAKKTNAAYNRPLPPHAQLLALPPTHPPFPPPCSHQVEVNVGDKLEKVPLLQGADLLLLAQQLVGEVAALSRGGAVHRDLKPDNVVVSGFVTGRPAWWPAAGSRHRTGSSRASPRPACTHHPPAGVPPSLPSLPPSAGVLPRQHHRAGCGLQGEQ